MTNKRKTTSNSDVPLTRAMLRAATNSKYFGRGEEYFDMDAVRSVKLKEGKIYATVQGSSAYRTTLWVEDGEVDGECTCPLGRDGAFCKHLVATGLMWIESRADIRQAMVIDDFVSWRETSSYSAGVDRVIERLRGLLDDDHAPAVIELVEYAMELWEEAIQSIDDSDGCMGTIIDGLHELHLDACKRAKPDPIALAERLFDRHVNSGWDIFSGAYEVYGSILGETGKARYRELAEAEWAKMPRIAPGVHSALHRSRHRANAVSHPLLGAPFTTCTGLPSSLLSELRRDASVSCRSLFAPKPGRKWGPRFEKFSFAWTMPQWRRMRPAAPPPSRPTAHRARPSPSNAV